jgi:hypothetical protein
MENTTMTIDATYMSRVRSVCPEAGRVLLAGAQGWIQGTAVPASVVLTDGPAPTFHVDGLGAGIARKDFVFRPFGEPPV